MNTNVRKKYTNVKKYSNIKNIRLYIETIQICLESIRMHSESILLYFDCMQLCCESISLHSVILAVFLKPCECN